MSTSPSVPGPGGEGGRHGASAGVLAERVHRCYRDAWLSLLLFLVTLALTVVVYLAICRAAGYTTVWATSYPAGESSPVGWAARGLWVLMTALYAWPEGLVLHFAREASRLGRVEWLAPVVVGGVLAALLPVLNLGLLVG